jgi:zinc transport system permease protein
MWLEILQHPPAFLILALLGGLGLAVISAPLGVFMVWQKQSYFGATLAHSALLGISLGLFFSINLTLSVIVFSFVMAIFIHSLQKTNTLSSDTLLGLLAHTTLALGLVVLSLMHNVQIDFMSYLFGDILSLSKTDLIWIFGLFILTLIFFYRHWQDMLNVTLNPQLAQVEGVAVQKIQLTYTLLLSLMIALSMKLVGVLLVTSLLIIPAAAARRISNTPEQMLGYTLIIGCLSIVFGIFSSMLWNIPTGPSIVMVASAIFVLLWIFSRKAK